VQLHANGVVLRDKIEGARIKTKKQQVCQKDELLVAEIDAKVGGYGMVPVELEGAIVSSHYFLFSVNRELLLPDFLGYYVKTPYFRDQVSAQGSTNYAAIRPGHVLDYVIPIPPLDEQRRIVDKIDRLAAMVDEAHALRVRSLNEAAQWVPSVAHQLFAGYLPRKSNKVCLGEISEVRSGVTLGRQLAGDLIELPYLRVANVQDGYLDLDQVKMVWIKSDERDKWQLEGGDLLLTEGGDWDKLGRGTVWRDEVADCIHQNHIFRVRLCSEEFDPEYVLAVIRSPYGKDYFKEASKQTTNLASINQRQLKAFPIFKIPLEEQRRIVTYLNGLQAKMDHLKTLQQKTSTELEALLPAILDKAFKGSL
jgi:type I restriction enzyme S subunit